MSYLLEMNGEDFERQAAGGLVFHDGKYYRLRGADFDEDLLIVEDEEGYRIRTDDVDVVCPDLSGFMQCGVAAIYLFQDRVRQFHRTASLGKYRNHVVAGEMLREIPNRMLEEMGLVDVLEPSSTALIRGLNTKYNDVATATSNIDEGNSLSEALSKYLAISAYDEGIYLVNYKGVNVGTLDSEGVELHPLSWHLKEYIEINCNIPVKEAERAN